MISISNNLIYTYSTQVFFLAAYKARAKCSIIAPLVLSTISSSTPKYPDKIKSPDDVLDGVVRCPSRDVCNRVTLEKTRR